MRYNLGKFQVLNIGKNSDINELLIFTDNMEDIITEKSEVKDISILTENKVMFREQTSKSVKMPQVKQHGP